MKTIKYFSLILLTLLFAVSCSEEKKEDKVSVKTAKISGPLSPYFEVVPKDYKVQCNMFYSISFEIKRIADGLPEPWSAELANSGKYDIVSDISVELLDADGNVLEKTVMAVDTDELFALGVGESTSFDCLINKKAAQAAASARFGSSFKMNAQATDSINDADADLDEAMEDIDKGLEVIGATTEALKNVSEIVSK